VYKRNSPQKEYSVFEEHNVVKAVTVRQRFGAENLKIEIQPWEGISDDFKEGVIQPNSNKRQVPDQLFVDQNGNIINPLDFSLGGIWFDYRLADKLPLSYRLTNAD
jgi:hypothetical protein